MKRKIIKKRTYTIIETEYSDHSKDLTRTNNGFNPMELVGICTLINLEITALFSDQRAYRVIKRIMDGRE